VASWNCGAVPQQSDSRDDIGFLNELGWTADRENTEMGEAEPIPIFHTTIPQLHDNLTLRCFYHEIPLTPAKK
jgi:hypothetical protein